MNTALTALLLTIASPAQGALAALFAIPVGLAGQKIASSPAVYPHIEIDDAIKRIDWCNEVYGPDHYMTGKAIERLPFLIAEHYEAKCINRNDLHMFATNGHISIDLYQQLTGQAF